MKIFRFDKFVYSVSLCALLMLSSCSDFLRDDSPDLLIPADVVEFQSVLYGEGYPKKFTEEADFVQLMTDDVGVSPTSDSRSVLWEGDDEYALATGKGAFTWAQDIAFYDGTYSKFYLSRYTNIMACNIIIENAETMTGDRDKVASCVAQAYALRAWNYLWLVNLYGLPYNEQTAATDMGVVVRLESGITRDQPARNTVKEVYDQINADLDRSLELWKSGSVSRNKHVLSERATYIIKCRAALYQGQWDEVIKYGKLLSEANYDLYNISKIDPSVMTNVGTKDYAFLDPEVNTENIYMYGGSTFDSNKFMSNIRLLKDAAFVSSQAKEGDLIQMYEPGDQRIYAFFQQNTMEKGEYYDYRHAPNKRYKSSIYSQALRTSEALLSVAEAHVQKGSEADKLEAIKLLNLLRSNRFTPDTYKELTAADFATTADLLQFVRDERRRELCFEDVHRWVDLRRYGMPRLVHTFYSSKNSAPEVYVLEQGDRNYTLELPIEELDFNKVIEPTNRRVITPGQSN
ncbi:MAG: RagB/SusD family nutrient uptake outer membrane protein [Prevotella sp.]|nr:RagB/SusD family nutrient uptake outer membrane protein [Prevotella sp.]MBR6494153.1 RagB/SusD family nutrient uptake outer membrane protein [Prevotella sp.]